MHTPVLHVSIDDPRHKAFAEWFGWAVNKVRLGMATYALNEGFNLTEILELRGVDWRNNAMYLHLRDRVSSGDLAAILFHGDVSVEKINRIAADQGVRVYELAPVYQIGSAAPWEDS